MKPIVTGVMFALCFAAAARAAGAPHRYALLVGINDYSASTLPPHPGLRCAPDRDWPNLGGAVNDVLDLHEMLTLVYGFSRRDVVVLKDQEATRDAIVGSIQQLVDKAAKDDVVLFYYAGHGSQVRNSLSDERDQLDESLVPADSRLGAPDIRDKELRTLFNRILDRGAKLTIIIDACHSGSAARGLPTGARRRAVRADNRDVADRSSGPRPESRGALVLSASQDYENAWERRDEHKRIHGVFSWALLRSLRDAATSEPASETFLRAQARMRAETPFQEPVLAGTTEVKLNPLFGARTDRRDDHTIVAIAKVHDNETVTLEGGWANGLTPGSELRIGGSNARLVITAVNGLGESVARIESPDRSIHAGALAEVTQWAVPPSAPLRVWAPQVAKGCDEIASVARDIALQAADSAVRWVTNPVDATPTHVLRQEEHGWSLAGASSTESLASDHDAIAAIAKLPPGSSLFVQFAAPQSVMNALGIEHAGVARAASPDEADYLLIGRYTTHHLSYAWLRPSVRRSDRRKSGLPVQTRWRVQHRNDEALRATAAQLREDLLHLRKTQGWMTLESPPGARYPFEVGIRRTRDGELMRDAITGGEKYQLVLRTRSLPMPAHVPQRYIYVFAIDSDGKSTLLFPPSDTGSVENRLPIGAPDTEIDLGESSAFEAAPPWGSDTYFLLSTDEPLPDPSILEWDGARTPHASSENPLERLLQMTESDSRSASLRTPLSWSIERVVFESLQPRISKGLR